MTEGSIPPGKFADLVILSGDPLKAGRLIDLHVEMTLIRGEVVYEH